MKEFFCDRCGTKIFPFRSKVIVKADVFNEWCDIAQADLCESCGDLLIEWLNANGGNRADS